MHLYIERNIEQGPACELIMITQPVTRMRACTASRAGKGGRH